MSRIWEADKNFFCPPPRIPTVFQEVYDSSKKRDKSQIQVAKDRDGKHAKKAQKNEVWQTSLTDTSDFDVWLLSPTSESDLWVRLKSHPKWRTSITGSENWPSGCINGKPTEDIIKVRNGYLQIRIAEE